MAEDQDKKQKPKATLIKHRKDEAKKTETPAPVDKKKVVVVKKKVVVVKKTPKVKANKADEENKATATPESGSKPSQETSSIDKKQPQQRTADNNQRYQNRPDDNRYNSQQNRRPGGDRNFNNNRPGGNRNFNNNRPGGDRNFSNNRPGGDRNFNNNRPGGDRNFSNNRPGGDRNFSNNRPGGNRNFSNNRPGGDRNFSNNRPGGGGRPFNRNNDNRNQGGPQGRRPFNGPQNRFNKPGGSQTPIAADASNDKKSINKKFFKAKKKVDYQKYKKEENQEKVIQLKKKTVQRANPVPKEIDIMEVITVSELARKMNLKASELISKLMSMGMMVTINQQIDAETAEILASEYKCKVKIVSLYDETIIETEDDKDEDLKARPPIITIMGHVDHGKTKLLDAIRETDVVASEFGGITQHIGAYLVKTKHGELVFLDTPGHEAFTLMRARGAQITDIVILVVAANDGVMPQTIEAIDHAKEAKVPIIVAVNKVDLPDANVDRVKQQLSEYELIPEDWGGSTLFCEISALKRQGISELLDTILLQSDILELKSNYNCRAEGKVIESKVDPGRGTVSTVLIQRGTLKIGDTFVAGVYSGRVRAMFNDKGQKILEATPAMPVEILGFTGVPNAGDPFQATENEKIARQVGSKRQELEKLGVAQNVKKVTLDNLYDSIQEGEIQELKVVVKGDVQGSVEALKTALEKLSTAEIKLHVIHSAAGAIIENDVTLAAASNAIIVGFHVRPTPKAQELSDKEKVDIRKYNIIYDAVEDIKSAMEGLLAPELKEETVGAAEVREVFKVPKIGLIAGCYVTSGKIKRGLKAVQIREGLEIYTGNITSLKRFKDDVKSVDTGYECGIGLENNNDIQEGDIIEVIEIREIAKKLGAPKSNA